jgi:hypothetical protein
LGPIGILPRVVKTLQHFTILIDSHTDGLVPVGILSRIAKKLQPLPHSPMAILTHSSTDGAHSKAYDCQTA